VVRLLSSLSLTSDAKKNKAATVKFSADERTNSILLSGEKASRLKYRAIISHLDSPVESTGNTHVVYLRFADAKNLSTILGNVGKEVVKSQAKNAGAAKGTTKESVSIQADETSNALVITAPASVYRSLRTVIQQLDIPRAQVHVEAIIAELSMSTSNELGVQWLVDGSPSNGPVLATDFPGSGTSITAVAAAANAGLNPGLGAGLSLALGRFDHGSLNFATLIRALESDSDNNLLSTPSIVTLDNQEAEIIVGENVPFLTGESTSSSSDTTNPFRTIERQDVGVSLKVKPQINEGNSITMSIEQEVSNVLASTTGAVDITTSKRSIKTTVQLYDGEMLVLGGLIDDSVIESEQKVPFLGDIPILGALFRSSSLNSVKRNLVVFIRATIIKDRSRARSLSLGKYNFMRDAQIATANKADEDDVEHYPVLKKLESY